jgi:putative ABC transport system permease protein
MIKQIITLTLKNWNKNKLLMIEFFISFVLIFIILSCVIWAYRNSKQKLGYNYKNISSVETFYSMEMRNVKDDEVKDFLETIPNVEEVTVQIYSHPFSKSEIYVNSMKYKDQTYTAPMFAGIGKEWHKVFEPNFIEGKGMTEADIQSAYCPCYITENLKMRVFGKNKAVGELIDVKHMGKFKVVGVIDYYRPNGELSNNDEYFLCFRSNSGKYNYDAYRFSINAMFNMHFKMFYIKSSVENNILFQNKIFKSIVNNYPKLKFEVNSLSEVKEEHFKKSITPFLIASVLMIFLIINVLFGMFGRLWYSVNSRMSEIGIRVAVGASKLKIYTQLLGEMLMMCTLSIIPAIILLSQLPVIGLFNVHSSVYILALIFSIIVLLTLVAVSSYLPARQATKIKVAVALHEN